MLRLQTSLILVAVLLLDAAAAPGETVIPGGGGARSDCHGAWRSAAPNRGKSGIDCQDGDPACDLDRVVNGMCAVPVAVCLHQDNLRRCTARAVRQVTVGAKPKRLADDRPVALPVPPPVPVTIATCGSDAVVTLPLRLDRRRRPTPSRRVTLRLVTVASGNPHTDDDRLRLRCVPNRGAGQCGANPDGGPAELRLVSGGGADLDLGWTGDGHGLGVVPTAELRVCLAGCGATATPGCRQRDPETVAVNAPTFGAPVPFLVAGIPTCLVNRFEPPGLAGFVADVAAGTVAGTVALRSEFYRTSLTAVCPRCSGPAPGDTGTCDAGSRQGRGCTTAGVIPVAGAQGDPTYRVSPDCLPAGAPLGAASLQVPLGTGVATLPGPKPCGAAQDDACGAGICDAGCAGRACVATRDGQCLDARGGVNQQCCGTDTERPCFATRAGLPIVRAGSATAPVPPFGDPTYPKVGGLTLAGTFCAPGAGSALVDALVGLPGPGAITLPMTAAWLP